MALKDPAWFDQVYAIFNTAGVPPEVWIPIMLHESGANPNAENNNLAADVTKPGTVPEWSVGLFQINVHAWAVKADGTRIHTTEEEAALAASMKDPVQNAKRAAAAMAPAWAAVHDSGLAASTPQRYWSWLVGIRSGWPGGSVDHPLSTSYGDTLKEGFAGVYDSWAKAINLGPMFAAGDPLIAPWFSGGAPSTVPSNPYSGTAPQSAYNSVPAAPGYPPANYAGGAKTSNAGYAGSPGATGGGGGGVIGDATAAATKAAQAVLQGEVDTLKADFKLWLSSDGAKTLLFFVVGFLLFSGAALAILWEGPVDQGARAGVSTTVRAGSKAAVAGVLG